MYITIPCLFRKPLSLVRTSAHIHLSSLGFQTGKQQRDAVEAALESMGAAFQSQRLDEVFQSEINLDRADGTSARIKIVSANTQLHALNDKTQEFKFGYEPEIGAVIDFFVPSDGTMVDVGANFGYFSLFLASRLAFTGSVYAFEPSERGFSDLSRLVQDAGYSDAIRTHKLALGDIVGQVVLYLSKSDGLSTTVGTMANQLERVLAHETVEVRRLDDFNLETVDLIKIDVEGAETQVIAGAIRTLRGKKPIVVFESWTSVDDEGAFDLLRNADYLFFIPGWRTQDGKLSVSFGQAKTLSELTLAEFPASDRKNLPQRINVVGVPRMKLDQLQAHITYS